MKLAIMGPNLPGSTEAFHVHRASCSDLKKMKVYAGQQVDTADVVGLRDIVEFAYDPGSFPEIYENGWQSALSDFKIYGCCRKDIADFDQAAEPKPEPEPQPEPKVGHYHNDRPDLPQLAEQVKQFAIEHRNDRLREWDVIADHWTIPQMVAELAQQPVKIRSYGGARRHFDWLVRLPNQKPAWANQGCVCMSGADAHPDA